MKEFKSRDKLTQRMTRDGAVLDNQTTGEEIHISERDAEKQLSPDGQPVQMGKRDAPMNPAEDVPKHGRQLRFPYPAGYSNVRRAGWYSGKAH